MQNLTLEIFEEFQIILTDSSFVGNPVEECQFLLLAPVNKIKVTLLF